MSGLRPEPRRGLGPGPQVRGRAPLLLLLSALGVVALEALRLPAALLLGPMLAAIVLAAADRPVPIPALPLAGAQAIVGCLVASLLPPTLFGAVAQHAAVFIVGVGAVIGAASILGYVLARLRVLPGTTAVWGSMPGAATAMTLMSEAFGADMRLVAFMQYSRVLCVALAATIVSRVFGGARAAVVHTSAHAFALPSPGPFAATLLLALAGATIGRVLRVPAGPLLVSMVAGLALKLTGVLALTLPFPLLGLSYAIVGWSIGGRFTRPVLRHVGRALPRVLAGIVALLASCALFAVVLRRWTGVSPLTAYLATSPGGADSVAILAASAPVDVPFVMAMQIGRFLLVLLVGPAVARAVARLVPDGGALNLRRPLPRDPPSGRSPP